MIDTNEVQGNVLYAYGDRFPCARYVLLTVDDKAAAREQLQSWFDKVTFGQRPRELSAEQREGPHVNLAFTYSGLQELGVPEALLCRFAAEFRDGARKRSLANGDVGGSAEDQWIEGLGRGHILLVVHARDETARDALVDELLAGLNGMQPAGHDLKAALREPGSGSILKRNGSARDPLACGSALHREQFGFADGCSQPAIEGMTDDPTGGGVYARTGPRWWQPLQNLESLLQDLGIKPVSKRWRGIRAGELILGYENEDGQLPGPPAPLGPNGTFMVYRPMRQDVEAFSDYVAQQAEALKLPRELVRAKIVGRWDDGTPLTLSPERPDPLIAGNRRRANDFLYQDDRDGYRSDADGHGCPLGAHIRRTNPRDGLPGGGERTMRHRIIRRGMPYDRGDDRGLAFVCFGASIRDGFEFIQREWCNSGAQLGLPRERDLLLQQGDKLTGMVISVPALDSDAPNKTVALKAPPKPFVTVLGCEYLFLPSRRACRWLQSLR